jgi:hypothetical protein
LVLAAIGFRSFIIRPSYLGLLPAVEQRGRIIISAFRSQKLDNARPYARILISI